MMTVSQSAAMQKSARNFCHAPGGQIAQPGKTISAHLAPKKSHYSDAKAICGYSFFFGREKVKAFLQLLRPLESFDAGGGHGNYVSYKIIVYYHKLGFAAPPVLVATKRHSGWCP